MQCTAFAGENPQESTRSTVEMYESKAIEIVLHKFTVVLPVMREETKTRRLRMHEAENEFAKGLEHLRCLNKQRDEMETLLAAQLDQRSMLRKSAKPHAETQLEQLQQVVTSTKLELKRTMRLIIRVRRTNNWWTLKINKMRRQLQIRDTAIDRLQRLEKYVQEETQSIQKRIPCIITVDTLDKDVSLRVLHVPPLHHMDS